METSAQQRRSGGRGSSHLAIHRGARRGAISRSDTSRYEGRRLSPLTGEAAIHTESGREAAATGDTDGAGPGGADGGEDHDRADLRGGFGGKEFWIWAEGEGERDTE